MEWARNTDCGWVITRKSYKTPVRISVILAFVDCVYSKDIETGRWRCKRNEVLQIALFIHIGKPKLIL